MRTTILRFIHSGTVLGGLLLATGAWAAGYDTAFLVNEDSSAEYYDISADGKVIVGEQGVTYVARWSRDGDQLFVEMLRDSDGQALETYSGGPVKTNADGSVVVGSYKNHGSQAFRWTEKGGFESLGSLMGDDDYYYFKLPTTNWSTVRYLQPASAGDENVDSIRFSSGATAVSDNGDVVVGWSAGPNSRVYLRWAPWGKEFSQPRGVEAFRWTEATGMVGLGDLAGGSFNSRALDVSGDGKVIVGYGTTGPQGGISTLPNTEAFRWTEATGMVGLGLLSWGDFTRAEATNTDGSVIVGKGGSSEDYEWEAFYWTQATGMVGLGDFPGGDFYSGALDVSGDGQVIVGYGTSDAGKEAFRWTEATGMQTIEEWLADHGGSVPGDMRLDRATATNADGSIVVGSAKAPQWRTLAWIARVSPLGSGLLHPGIVNPTMNAAVELPRLAHGLINLALNGAHHRPLMTQEFETDACGWATVDSAKYTRELDAEATSVEVGSCLDYLDDRLRVGIAAGQSTMEQDLVYGGSNDLDGYYVLLEADYRILDSLIGSVLLMQGNWDVDADRAYPNGALIDVSSGDTDVTERALRLRVDWVDAFRLGSVAFTPRAAYTRTDSEVDSYVETGGGFPVAFGDQSQDTDELRLGLDADWQWTNRTTLRAMLEGAYRFDDDAEDLQGQVIGLYSVTVPGREPNDSWARAGVEVEHQLTEHSAISVSLNGASQGEDPDLSGAISFRMGF